VFTPTKEQKAIIEADLVAQRVIACAGSGKTATCVRRLLEIRKRIDKTRGRVALLSYSNVAVDTFREEYKSLTYESQILPGRVLIATVDSFITSHVLAPHAARAMKCDRQPFLVNGDEPFLQAFKVFNGSHNIDMRHLGVSLSDQGDFIFEDRTGHTHTRISDTDALKAIRKLGRVGAYTYELGRYWALTTLVNEEGLAKILARRYPYILIDEAQDVGTMHGMILSVLEQSGSTLSVIGDPNQSIFDFADADGTFIRDFELPSNSLDQPLSVNHRSVREIVSVANLLAAVTSTSSRKGPTRKHGAYLLKYKKDAVDQLPATFAAILSANGYLNSEAAILCRGNSLVEQLSGQITDGGRGATEKFVRAAVFRDRMEDIAYAYEAALDGVIRILDRSPANLRRDVLTGKTDPVSSHFRTLVWRFLRDHDRGIPPSGLPAKSEWLPKLKARLPTFLNRIEEDCGFAPIATWRNNVTTSDLADAPLWQGDLITTNAPSISVRSVHRAKGQSIAAVLYAAKAADIKSLLAGPCSEDGRIGYVAITRACDLLILATPANTPDLTIRLLEEKGFEHWGHT
jgi:superfamily I DNA/RNA helicase